MPLKNILHPQKNARFIVLQHYVQHLVRRLIFCLVWLMLQFSSSLYLFIFISRTRKPRHWRGHHKALTSIQEEICVQNLKQCKCRKACKPDLSTAVLKTDVPVFPQCIVISLKAQLNSKKAMQVSMNSYLVVTWWKKINVWCMLKLGLLK